MNNNLQNIGKNSSRGRVSTVRAFAEVVRNYAEACFGAGVQVFVYETVKNNGVVQTGICIKDGTGDIAPVIYLDGYFEEYCAGKAMDGLCRDILDAYAAGKPFDGFDISSVTDFRRVQGSICFKLVNAERNRELLAGSPHLLFHDLAVVFYIIAGGSFKEGISTIAVKKDIQDMWGVDARTIYAAALRNTGLLLGCSVQSMADVLREMASEKLDGGCSADASFPIPMYVASNSYKFNGAAVLLYPGLLEWFADKAAGDFYILPSSIHEVLFLPCSAGFEPDEVRSIVHEVNHAEVLPEDFLSDKIYRYSKAEGRVEII